MNSCGITVVLVALASASNEIVSQSQELAWHGTTVEDLHREYGNIFKYGNRNAASHLWSTFILERAAGMTHDRLQTMFSGFCAISGSPVGPHDYNRYRLTLRTVQGGSHTGFMHYCCWPCVCDTQDFFKVDSRNVTLADGAARTYHFVVLGNPCENPHKLHEPFVQPFDGRETTIARDAAEVRCGDNGELVGATLSDHGYPIIGMFFDAPGDGDGDGGAAAVRDLPEDGVPKPGRVTTQGGLVFQDEREWVEPCRRREANGFDSGMGEIFRKVAAITPINIPETLPAPASATAPECDESDGDGTGASGTCARRRTP